MSGWTEGWVGLPDGAERQLLTWVIRMLSENTGPNDLIARAGVVVGFLQATLYTGTYKIPPLPEPAS